METPKVFKNTHTCIKTSMHPNDAWIYWIYCKNGSIMRQCSSKSMFQNQRFCYRIRTVLAARPEFPPDGFFCDPAAHRSCRRHSVFWAFCLPASMEDDAMDDWSQLWSCLPFLHGGCPTWFVWLDFTVNWGNTWKHPKKEHKGKSLK